MMQQPATPPPPDAIIYKLTAGYLLQLGNGNSIACTSVANLTRALRLHFSDPAPMKVTPPTRRAELATVPTREQVKSNGTLEAPPPEPADLRVVRSRATSISDTNGEVNPLLVQDNLNTLCVGYVQGMLSPEDWERGVLEHCPGISMKEAKLTLASYTGIPEAPPHRATAQRDEVDHYKMAPEIDKAWEDHDPVTVLELIEDLPVVTTIPTTVGIIETSVAETVPIDEESSIVKPVPDYAEDWMVQPL